MKVIKVTITRTQFIRGGDELNLFDAIEKAMDMPAADPSEVGIEASFVTGGEEIQ